MTDTRAIALASLALAGSIVGAVLGFGAVVLALAWVAEHTPPAVNQGMEWAAKAVGALFLLLFLWGGWAKFYDRFARRPLKNTRDPE